MTANSSSRFLEIASKTLGQPNYNTAYGFISGVNTPGALLGANCAFPSLTVSGFAALGGNGVLRGTELDCESLARHRRRLI